MKGPWPALCGESGRGRSRSRRRIARPWDIASSPCWPASTATVLPTRPCCESPCATSRLGRIQSLHPGRHPGKSSRRNAEPVAGLHAPASRGGGVTFWVTRDLVAEYRFGLCQYVRPYGVCKCESEQKSLRSVRGCLILPKPFKLEAKSRLISGTKILHEGQGDSGERPLRGCERHIVHVLANPVSSIGGAKAIYTPIAGGKDRAQHRSRCPRCPHGE